MAINRRTCNHQRIIIFEGKYIQFHITLQFTRIRVCGDGDGDGDGWRRR